MCRKLSCLAVFALAFAPTSVNAAVTPITSVTITRVDNPDGTPNFWLESITVESYTVPVLRLVTGVSEGVATAQPAPYNDITAADNFDLNLFAGRDAENPPTHQITELGGQSSWTDTNGDNPDFFVFETGGNQDINIEAILSGGTIGQSVTVPQATWGNTGLSITTSGPHNGQTIEGIAFAITDLLDQSGNNLTNSSLIEGIQITSDGYDPSCVCAVSSGKILVAYNPSPADGSLYMDTWVTLSWSPGDTAASHHVYMGESFDDVNDATNESDTFRGNQAATFYVAGFPGFAYPDGLVPGTTYYWRIDTVEADGTTKHKGAVWSFSIPSMKAHNPDPPDGAKFVDTDVTLSWTAGMGAKLHTVYFGDNFDTVNNAAGGAPQAGTTYNPGPLALETTFYWRVDEFDGVETHKGDIWSFTTLSDMPITDPSLVGWWKLDVGFGTVAIDWSGHGNNGTLTNGPQWVEGYDGGALQFDGIDDSVEFADFVPPMQGTITFWINPASVGPRGRIFGGHDAFEAYVENDVLANQLFAAGSAPEYLESNATIPTNTWTHVALTYDGTSHRLQIYVNGILDGEDSKADDVWAGGAFAFGHRADRDQEYYNGLLDDFRVYNVVLTQEEIETTMRGDPTLAWDPKPANGVITDVENAMPLSWAAGEKAAQHDVYFSTDRDAVANADASDTTGIYRGRQSATTFTPSEGVEWGGGPYYWRIDESNTDGSITTGGIWSFTVADYLAVDDFESYTNDDANGEAIWQHWIDGFGVVDNGSQVGELLPPYAEQTIVHGGRQSMPLHYNNTGGATNSEAVLTLTAPRDWTRHGVGELSLWLRGLPGSVGSFTEGPAGTYTMTASGADIWNVGGVEADEFHYAFKTLTGAGSIIARVNSIQNTNGWAKAGVMIRETLNPDSAHAFACITPSNGVAAQGRPNTGGVSFNDNDGGITAPHWVRLERDIAGYFTITHSANGTAWQAVTGAIPRNIQMSSNVYIGLAVTAHNANATCEAVFSNVTTTGNVSGQWMNQDIGIASNAAEPLYVAVSNAGGAPAVVANGDPAVATIDAWTEWRIPLRALADQGINLTNVDKIAIGLGRQSGTAAPGGSGTVYIDDIRLYRAAP